MSQEVEAAVRDALSRVNDPELHVDLVSAGMVRTARLLFDGAVMVPGEVFD